MAAVGSDCLLVSLHGPVETAQLQSRRHAAGKQQARLSSRTIVITPVQPTSESRWDLRSPNARKIESKDNSSAGTGARSQWKGKKGGSKNSSQQFSRNVVLVGAGVASAVGSTWLYNNCLTVGGGGGGGFGNGGDGGGGGGGGGGNHGPGKLQAGAAMAAESDDDDDDDDDDNEDEDGEDEKEKKASKVEEPPVETFDPHGMRVGTRVPVGKLNPTKRYKIEELELIDARNGRAVPKSDAFWDLVAAVRKGGVFTRSQLEGELSALSGSGMFQDVSMDGIALADGSLRVEVKFEESQWNPAVRVKVVNVGLIPTDMDSANIDPQKMEQLYSKKLSSARQTLLPDRIERELSQYVSMEPMLTARMLQKIRDKIQKWYQDKGYVCAQVVNFGNLNTEEVVCEVVEGDITGVDIVFQDRMNERSEGQTNMAVVLRELPWELKSGMIFNIHAGRKALQKIHSLNLFANIEVLPRPDEDLEGGIIVEVKLKELEPKTAEVTTEWSIAPGDTGKPTVVSALPGGSVAFEHRNLGGLNRSIVGSVASSNLLNPQEDLDFRLEYRHPYIDGIEDPRSRVGNVSIFNNRKQAAVFVGGPYSEEVPLVWVDRAGLKATLSENYTPQSKLTYGVVMEEVATRDENTALCTQAVKMLPNGTVSAGGTPTTHGDTGIDRVAFLQANLTRDNTTFVNGALVGSRDIFQVDQGIGVGTKFLLFNRHQLSLTRFIQLSEENMEKQDVPPWVAVLHAHYGGCVGDLPTYDAFTLGGPYSVRGYAMGELGASRRLLELAGEVRMPIRSTYAYAFAECGTDLGGSKEVRGNPTHFFGREGQGAAVGVGMKLSQVRAECVRDCNMGSWSYFLRVGDRF